MDVIKFPGDDENTPKIRTNPNPLSKLIVNNMKFTCTECHSQCVAEFSGLIFREIEFYCGQCGTYFKISNNAFTNTKK